MEEIMSQTVPNEEQSQSRNDHQAPFEYKSNKKGAVSLLAIKDQEDIVIQTSPAEEYETNPRVSSGKFI